MTHFFYQFRLQCIWKFQELRKFCRLNLRWDGGYEFIGVVCDINGFPDWDKSHEYYPGIKDRIRGVLK